MDKLTVINLYGGPGTGKSTAAAAAFAAMKQAGINVELVTEYAKDAVWEGRASILTDQLYMMAKQHRRISRLVGQVDVVVLDSPLLLGHAYIDRNGLSGIFDPSLISAMHALLDELYKLYDNIDFFLKRVKDYQQAGRQQSFHDARQLDIDILYVLESRGIPLIRVTADKHAADHIYMQTLKLRPALCPGESHYA